jgi:ribosomal protein L1
MNHRCDYCNPVDKITGKRPKKAKPSFKHWDFNKLLNNIKLHINFIKDDKFNNVNGVSAPAFTAESLSEQFKAKRKLIDKAIHIIKRDSIPGYYINESNSIMHDSNRDPMNGGGPGGWMATVYYIHKKELNP